MWFHLSLVVIINILCEGDALVVSQFGIRFRIPLFVANDNLRLLTQNLLIFNQRSLNRHLRVAEKGVRIDFGVFGLFKVSVAFDYVPDMAIGNESVLVSEIPFHLVMAVNGVDELNLALSCLRFSVRQDPDIRGDTGVEEQLFRQGDNTLQPVVFDDIASDFALAATVQTRFASS